MAKMVRRFATGALAAGLFAALGCGGDDDGSSGDGDGDGVDASPSADGAAGLDGGGTDGGDLGDCPLPAELGALGALANTAGFQMPQDRGMPDGLQVRSVVGGLVDSQVTIELYDGAGAFAEGEATPGTFAIEGDDAGANICGLCVALFGASEPKGDRLFYFAVSGSVVIDSVDETLSGRLEDITFREVDPESPDGGPLDGGCTTHLEGISFSAPLIQR